MVRIRLSIANKTKHTCSYDVIVTDARNPRDGAFLVKVGHYHPYMSATDPKRCVIDLNKLDNKVKTGAGLTDRVLALVRQQIAVTGYQPSAQLSAFINKYEMMIASRKVSVVKTA